MRVLEAVAVEDFPVITLDFLRFARDKVAEVRIDLQLPFHTYFGGRLPLLKSL